MYLLKKHRGDEYQAEVTHFARKLLLREPGVIYLVSPRRGKINITRNSKTKDPIILEIK